MENPIDAISVYRKDDPQNVIKIWKDDVSGMLPSKFKEQVVRVFCKKDDDSTRNVALRLVGLHIIRYLAFIQGQQAIQTIIVML